MAGGKFRAASDATLALETGVDRWLALLTTLPTHEDGTGLVEVTGGAYARVKVNATVDWSAVTTLADKLTRQTGINADKSFPEATAAWGTVVGWALFDAVTAGNKRRWGVLEDGSGNPTSQAVSSGTTFTLAANTASISEA